MFRVNGRVTDIGVDLDEKVPSDDHRLELGVPLVGRDDGSPGGYLAPDKLWLDPLPDGSESHLGGDEALPGEVKLGLHGPFVSVSDPGKTTLW